MEQELAVQEKYAAFCRRLENGIKVVQTYEDPQQQAVALEQINFNTISQYLEEDRATAQSTGQSESELVLRAIMRWFKQDFFQWCNQPACQNTHIHSEMPQRMQSQGMGTPNSEEREQGWASRVELYRCENCSDVTRFARFNNPGFLLQHPPHRRGRCGEWANAFGLVLRALSFDVRYVMDWTDHVWVEVYLPELGRYVHLDPCERAFDTPLLYEGGWGKKLSYVVGVSRFGMKD
eukprot:gene32326-39095_t